MIRIENLKKRYAPGQPWALDGLDLHVPKGALFGLLGPNGAGKTSLINALFGLIRADSGSIHVDGEAVPAKLRKVAGRIDLAPQSLAFYPTLTVRENLEFFARVGGAGGVDSALAQTGLADHLARRAGILSGGLKRRLNLAIALLGQPALLVLDEPTVGVDAQSRGFILEALRALNGRGTTILYTTHYLDEAQRLCRQVAIIDHGRILASGELPALLGGDADLEALFLRLTGTALRDA